MDNTTVDETTREPGDAVDAAAAGRKAAEGTAAAGAGSIGRHNIWTLLVVCAATFMLLLDVTIVTVALPDIQHELSASFTAVQWVIDAYALTLAALLLVSGSLADRFGLRLVFTVGLVVFTGGSALCAGAQDATMLVLSRAVQGIGGAILFATSLALLAVNFHGKARGMAFGVWGAVTGVATSLGPILGGALTTGVSWRAIFWINIPIGVIAVVATLRYVAESKSPHAARPDWTGAATFTAGLVALVYGLIRAGQEGWTDGAVLGCFAAAVVLLAAFVVVERRVAHPMFDLSLLRIPTFLGGSIAAFAMNGSLFAMFLYVVIYLQNGLGYSALETGVRMLLVSGMTLVAATVAGRASAHVSTKWLIGPGLALVAVGLFLMMGLDAGSDWTHFIAGFVVAGLGAGLVNPPLASTAIGVVAPQRSGMASGINNTCRQVGIAVGTAVYGTIFATSMRGALEGAGATGQGAQLAGAVQHGSVASIVGSAPPEQQASLAHELLAGFAGSMDDLLLTGGIVALVGAVLAIVLIRSRDFVQA
ncbi:MFS transporter [Tomitella gaofuii]|uniref:MFS transporter n=1 Tax=Tomitella gaofuii TaxID=2760083 RepID=UPI002E2B5456|nr:MFS transporter [Tomitella gaofuii]